MILEVSFVIFLFMIIVFLVSLIRRDNSTADIGWCGGMILITFYSLFVGGGVDLVKSVVAFFVLIWGVRLSVYIFLRNQGKPEDFRYRKMRETWKYFTLRSFFEIYMFQGFIMFIVSMPLWLLNYSGRKGFDIFDLIGAILFLTGFYFEIMADAQLRLFKKDPSNEGKIMTRGVWSLSRHPNYFGEALIWWGLAMFALHIPYGWLSLISPVLMTFILRYVTGVTMLEERMKQKPGWEEYEKTTPPFVPEQFNPKKFSDRFLKKK